MGLHSGDGVDGVQELDGVHGGPRSEAKCNGAPLPRPLRGRGWCFATIATIGALSTLSAPASAFDTERGVALSIVRFGYKEGTTVPGVQKDAAPLVAEFFAIHDGKIQEIQVCMTLLPASSPTGW